MISKVLKKIIIGHTCNGLKKQDKKRYQNHREWEKLNKDEKHFRYCDKYFLTMMKNIYIGFNDCSKEDFVSDYFFQSILLPKLNWINNRNLGFINGNSYFSDKNYQHLFLNYARMPKVIIRKINGVFYDEHFNIISKKEALKLLSNHKQLVFKVSIGSSHGKGVELVSKDSFEEKINSFGKNIIIQEKIKQSHFLENFNKTSVNIIRITSLLINDEIVILSAILRVGAPGSFCDHLGFEKNNPRVIGLDKNGNLFGKAIDPDGCYIYDDIFGKKIEGEVPNFKMLCEIVKKEHKKFSHTRIIGWDFTLNENDLPICIEFNSTYPGIVQSQMVCGPLFGSYINNTKIIDLILEIK